MPQFGDLQIQIADYLRLFRCERRGGADADHPPMGAFAVKERVLS
jgi:hypothetical protein